MRVACGYEDRVRDLIGLKLLATSVHRHCPSLPLRLTAPQGPPGFREFFARFPNVSWVSLANGQHRGWDVKPVVLLEALDAGASEAIWIDSDIIFNGDPRRLLASLGPTEILCAEERAWSAHDGGSERTRLWGLEVGRSVPRTMNSCVLRVTNAHRDLLRAWMDLLARPEYRQVQSMPVMERPFHMLGDQEALTALLGDKRFADVPIRYLRRGRDIAHCFAEDGYTLGDRLWNLGRGLPVLVHCPGSKVWDMEARRRLVHLDRSPFLWLARHYRDELGDETGWMEPLHPRPWDRWFPNHPNLLGLGIALSHQMRRIGVRSTLRRIRNSMNLRLAPV
jgi:hypothetical protein